MNNPKNLKNAYVSMLNYCCSSRNQYISRKLYISVEMLFTAFLLSNLLLFSVFAQATERVDLYTTQIAVETRTAKERNQVAEKALADVFIRASGSVHVIQHFPSLKRHLHKASRYLNGYQYIQLDSHARSNIDKAQAQNTNNKEQLALQLMFNELDVRHALEQAGAPFWPAKRPSVLVWLVQQQDGSTDFINTENHPGYFQYLTSATNKRGIPFIAPQFNQKALGISPDDVWQYKRSAILNVSKPYNADIILLGRVTKNYRGYIGQWSSFNIADGQVHALEADTIEQFITDGVYRTADQLARRFAINVVSENTDSRYALFIGNIASQQDYLSLMEYLESIDVIRELKLVEIQGDQLQFNFGFNGSPRKVPSLLTLDGRLIHDQNDGGLVFNWRSTEVDDNK